MNDKELLGTNLRRLRLQKHLTLKKVAELAGCSESLLSKIENGRGNPSFNTLHAIASAAGTDIGTLFLPATAKPNIVSRKGERTVTQVANDQQGVILEYLSPHGPENMLQGHIHIIAPGGGPEGTITHEGEELGYVLDGQIELSVDGDVFFLREGDSFFFNSELPHMFKNPGKVAAKVVWVNTPPTF